jgi:hypothetical protein
MADQKALQVRFRYSLPKKVLFSLLAMALAMIASLGSAEILFLLIHGDKYKDLSLNYFPPRSVIYDSDLGWKYRPGYRGRWHFIEYEAEVSINSLGLRDREYGEKAGPRNLFLGDSFTFGVGVDIAQTFVRLIEEQIGGNGNVECINGGRVGAGSDEYRHYAKRYVSKLTPDAIVICIFPENDFDDTWAFHYEKQIPFREVNGEVYIGDEPLARERKQPVGILFGNSALYRFLRLRLCRFPIGMNAYRKTWLDVYLKEEPDWVRSATRLVFENLEAIGQICKDANISLALVLIPSRQDLDSRHWRRIITALRRPLEAYAPDKPFELLCHYGKEKEIPVLDLREPMRASGKMCHFKHDGHFNPLGHRIAAAAIAKFLIENRTILSVDEHAASVK